MKIRTRLTLQFSVIVSVILIAFSLGVYFFSENHRKEEFYNRLRDKARTSVKLLSDVDEVDNNLLKIIDRNSMSVLPDERVIIYDFNNRVVYTSNDLHRDTFDLALVNRVRNENEVRFYNGRNEAIGILFTGKLYKYVVFAEAYDRYGLSKLNYLKYILISGVLVTIMITVLVGLFFSRQALNPISDMVSQIDTISISNLQLRVSEGNGTDEIAQLATKFNKMLERLDAAFEMQRSFVANASHELRTPLTALTGQLEVALMKTDNDPWEVLRELLNDIRQLNKLSNGLLDLAQANLDISEISITAMRIDEVIGAARAELLRRNKNYTVTMSFNEFPEEENWLRVEANEQLLRSALLNIIENGCKYSEDHRTDVELAFDRNNVIISISDKGIGIPEADLARIFEPFFRSGHAKNYRGHGIGLTLAKKITELHKGTIELRSRSGQGTIVRVTIPHL